MTQPKIFLFLAIALIVGLFVVRGCNPNSGVEPTGTRFNPGKPILSPAGLADGVQQWKVEKLFADAKSAAYGYAILKWPDGTELRCIEGHKFGSPNVCDVSVHYLRHLQKTDTSLAVAGADTMHSVKLSAPQNCKQTEKLEFDKILRPVMQDPFGEPMPYSAIKGLNIVVRNQPFSPMEFALELRLAASRGQELILESFDDDTLIFR